MVQRLILIDNALVPEDQLGAEQIAEAVEAMNADRNTAIAVAVAAAIETVNADRDAAIADIKQHRAGPIVIESGDITLGVVAKRVDFTVPMPADSTYQVQIISNGLAGAFSTSAQDVDGFTLDVTSAIAGTVGYIAVQE